MEKYIQDSELNNDFRTYTNKQQRMPEVSNKFNQDYLYGGPTGLKRDYDALYKALELETVQRLNSMENGNQNLIDQANYFKNENLKYKDQFDKVLNDNKALYLRCKELESYLFETNPNFKGQYESVIQENENLRRQMQYGGAPQQTQLGNSIGGGYSSGLQQQSQYQQYGSADGIGIQSSNRMQQLQREIEDLKRENYDLKVRLQAQLQDKGVSYSRSQITSPTKQFSQSVLTSPVKPPISHQNYCDNLISVNEQHNRAVLERCKSIVAQHNYY